MTDAHTVHLKLTSDELAEIDRWKEVQRIRTRSEAIRQMIRLAIACGESNKGLGEEDRGIGFEAMPKAGAFSGKESDGMRELLRVMIKEELGRVKTEHDSEENT